jgi:hypothetical protein
MNQIKGVSDHYTKQAGKLMKQGVYRCKKNYENFIFLFKKLSETTIHEITRI